MNAYKLAGLTLLLGIIISLASCGVMAYQCRPLNPPVELSQKTLDYLERQTQASPQIGE